MAVSLNNARVAECICSEQLEEPSDCIETVFISGSIRTAAYSDFRVWCHFLFSPLRKEVDVDAIFSF